jgi:eukaryotic-like serine/threonine-protein kinase
MSVSPDGKVLIFKDLNIKDGSSRTYTLSLNGDPIPKLLFQVKGNVIGATLSPDGRWLAYEWDQEGPIHGNIYVGPFPPTGVRYQISTDGGWEPMWSRDGKRLFYVHNVGSKGLTFLSVDIRTEPSFAFGKSTPLFTLEGRLPPGARNVDFSPASDQFVAVLLPPDIDSPREVDVVLNWTEELKQRVPVK